MVITVMNSSDASGRYFQSRSKVRRRPFAPGSPHTIRIYKRGLFVIVQSESTKRRDGYMPAG